MDPRMGTSSKSLCDTCGEPLKACNGHFGQVKLALPVFHIGYLRFVVELLHCICKVCMGWGIPGCGEMLNRNTGLR